MKALRPYLGLERMRAAIAIIRERLPAPVDSNVRPMSTLLLAAGLLLTSFVALAGDQLVQREIVERNPGGKDLVMSLHEIQRSERTSLVKVHYKSGASVASSMFVVQGMYDIAKARNAKYFVKLKEWSYPDGGRVYLVGFTSEEDVSISDYFGIADATATRHELVSVEQYATMFR